MKLWASLYAMIWLVLLQFLTVFTPGLEGPFWRAVHVLLGLAIVGLAFSNDRRLRATRVPGRLKRIAKATFSLSLLMMVLGALMFFDLGGGIPIPLTGVSVLGLLAFVHLVNAFAIITQAAAVAIAYDMWEDREFLEETEPGVVPPAPAPVPPWKLPRA